jgi:DNA-binding response OmpR family regulator
MKILVVEDDPRVASLLRRGLEEQGYEIIQAYDGSTGLTLALQLSPDLVVTDIVLPNKNGLELCASLKQQKPNLPILMLTALGHTDDKVDGFNAGADDYLVKPFEMRELMARVKALLRRPNTTGKYFEILTYSDLQVNLATKEVKRQQKPINLTPKEFKLLTFMIQNAEVVLSRSEISENVWETHFDTGTNFIDVYINYLRKKIDKDFEPKLIHTRPGMGFILKKET